MNLDIEGLNDNHLYALLLIMRVVDYGFVVALEQQCYWYPVDCQAVSHSVSLLQIMRNCEYQKY